MSKEDLPDGKEMCVQTLSGMPTVTIVDCSSFCPRCLSRHFDKYCAVTPHMQETQEQFQIRCHDDGLKIEHVGPLESGGGIFLKGAMKLTRSSRSASEEAVLTIQGKQTLYSLLMELVVAKTRGCSTIDLDRVELFDLPLQELSRLIQSTFWENLTRCLDMSNAALSGKDPKVWTDDPRPRIYVPHGAPEQHRHYSQIAIDNPELGLDVQLLPESAVTPQLIREMNDKPGALALAMEGWIDDYGRKTLRALPFVVPGGRFNEMYGWDSYFQALGLLANGYVDVCESMVKHLCFCIQHYGKILNANRSYYLGRSQPPFLTAMGLAVFEKMEKKSSKALEFIRLTLVAAIKEYYLTWMTEPRYHGETGLSRYQGEGLGFPPEVEPHHFDSVISIYAEKHNMSPSEFVRAYNDANIEDADLDEYLKHDRASRESGHDTTYRFVDRAADLATVDLNSCLYRYEIDIAHIINTHFNGRIHVTQEWRSVESPAIETASSWIQRAARRRNAIDKYLWSQEKGMYFDYNTREQAQVWYESATTLWPLWAGVASSYQAESLVSNAIPKLEVHGGLVSSTQTSRGDISPSRPLRQWDYPHGWAPHQILAWDGLRKYGHHKVAERLAYRWISMILKTYSDHNGLVVEKYEVTREDNCHVVEAEYGNQGSDLSTDVQTGFGWTNASFVHGLSILQSSCETCQPTIVQPILSEQQSSSFDLEA